MAGKYLSSSASLPIPWPREGNHSNEGTEGRKVWEAETSKEQVCLGNQWVIWASRGEVNLKLSALWVWESRYMWSPFPSFVPWWTPYLRVGNAYKAPRSRGRFFPPQVRNFQDHLPPWFLPCLSSRAPSVLNDSDWAPPPGLWLTELCPGLLASELASNPTLPISAGQSSTCSLFLSLVHLMVPTHA